jgi:hypothetical protein
MADISVEGVNVSFPSRGIMVTHHAGGPIHVILGPGAILTLTVDEFSKIVSCAEVPE